MKIVILDGYTENPGDLSWQGFEALGELTVYDRTPGELIVERAKDAEIVYTNKTPLTAETLERLQKLQFIGVLATGYNVVDTKAATARGVKVANIPTYGTSAVAQYTFALLLEICHHVGAHSGAVHAGRWSAQTDFCFWDYPLIELSGKTMGLIGFGRIGQAVAKIAVALGMDVLAFDQYRIPGVETERIQYAPLERVLSESDVIQPALPAHGRQRGHDQCAHSRADEKGRDPPEHRARPADRRGRPVRGARIRPRGLCRG